jgi:hypothetical protein
VYPPGNSRSVLPAFLDSFRQKHLAGDEIIVGEFHVCQGPQQNRAGPTSIECFCNELAGFAHITVV